jgi:DNA (cytosine-5)-methyltransferase 1
MEKEEKLTLIDLFAGCGGISEGFSQAGYDIVSAVEFDQQIANTLQKNHINTKIIVDDICNISSTNLVENHKTIDVIAGGPPCQGFSMAGRRIRGSGAFLNDPRNNLFKEFYRVVSEIKPKIFIMENVPGILNINNGEVKHNILKLFKSVGYKTSYKVLLASEYGVPQLRKRAYFIGNNFGIDSEELFPPKTHGTDLKDCISIEDAIFDLPFINEGEGKYKSTYDKIAKSNYQKQMRGSNIDLYNHISSKHDPKTLSIMKMIKEGKGMRDLPSKYRTKSVHSGAYGRMLRTKPAYTITTRFDTPPVGRVTHPILNRSITAREAARIQSFPDRFIFYGSKTSIGKQIGNAVPPLLSKNIANNLKQFLS